MKRASRSVASILGVALIMCVATGGASAVTATVVRPGSLHGWIPFDGVGPNGRWVTGPGTAPLGRGSAQLKASTSDALEYDYTSPTHDLSTFVATYQGFGSSPAVFGILTDANVGPGNFQDLFLVPSGAPGWHPYDATSATTWTWDCDGDGTFEGGPGSIADFGTACDPTAKVAAVALIANGADTYVDDVVLGPSGSTKTYNMEPPVVSVLDKKKLEGDVGKTTMSFKVKLSGRNDDPIHVNFATANGTAVAGRDYVARRGTLKIPAGAPYGIIKIAIIGDTKNEPNQRFKLKLSAPKNAMFGRRVAIGTIIDDD